MASKRMVNGNVWEDDFFLSLTMFERLLWLGILTACADDQGRLQDHPALIRSKVFPIDDIPLKDIEAGLVVFAEAGKIDRYESDGKKAIQIVNWWKHQRSQWASASDYPAPSGWVDRERYHKAGNELYTNNGWSTSGGYQANYVAPLIDGCNGNDVKDDVKGEDEGKVEEKEDEEEITAAAVFKSYEKEIGVITESICGKIKVYLEDDKIPNQWIVDALEESSAHNARNWKYTSAILDRWAVDGKSDKRKKVDQKAKVENGGAYV